MGRLAFDHTHLVRTVMNGGVVAIMGALSSESVELRFFSDAVNGIYELTKQSRCKLSGHFIGRINSKVTLWL